jgi:hypothetical protein
MARLSVVANDTQSCKKTLTFVFSLEDATGGLSIASGLVFVPLAIPERCVKLQANAQSRTTNEREMHTRGCQLVVCMKCHLQLSECYFKNYY